MDSDTLKDIEQSCKTIEALESKTDEELAKLLIDHVWKYLSVFSAASDLISACVDRLRGYTDKYDPH